MLRAYNDVIGLYNKIHPTVPWILHGYSGNIQITEQLAGRNILFSFGEILFKQEAKAIESFQFLSPEMIFFETDEFEGDVEKMYKQGAELKGMDAEVLKKNIWENFNRIENVKWNG